MSADAIDFLTWFFPAIWKFFTDWKIPGTNTTPASWAFFLMVAGLVLTIIPKFFNVNWFDR